MGFWNNLKNILTGKPRSSTEFVQKFIKDSKKSRVQFEIIENNEILIQVDSLRFTPSWFKVFDINKTEFENGFVIFFIIDQKKIEKDKRYILYKKSELNLLEFDEMHGDTPIRTFARFIEETDDAIYLGKEMKTILDGIYSSNEQDPQALFNLRYINVK